MIYYKDRYDAGRKLAENLLQYKDENPIIIALPRGGVVVGFEIAKILQAPLDVLVARKIGAPFYPELGIGAIAPNNVRVLDNDLINSLNVSKQVLGKIIEEETEEMNRRIELYRGKIPLPDLCGKTVILVDDGLATGVTARAAVLWIKKMTPKKIILAVPVSPPDTAEYFRNQVDELICLHEPPEFYAVSAYYLNFEQTTDNEVISLLEKAKKFTHSD